MNNFTAVFAAVNERINAFVWGPVMLAAFLTVGIIFTAGTRFFQITHIRLWMKTTIFAALTNKDVRKTKDKGAVSQLQALCSSLAACIGTGNIVGVATALYMGGAGSVFWMWVSAILGMMTSYAENILGIKYRYKNEKGEWIGGAMVYIERGLKSRPLAVIFAVLCVFVSFGMGNMTQINSMSVSLEGTFSVPPVLTGMVVAAMTALIIFGGVKRIVGATEKIVPIMSVAFLLATIVVIAVNFRNIPNAIKQIFEQAWSFNSVAGGAAGFGIGKAIRYGVSRGVFSNEAGLGSSAIIHSASDVKEPCIQGMWGIFEVFTDTVVMCTLTALTILCSGIDLNGSINGAQLSSMAFESVFGRGGEIFVTISITLFAFATIIGWSYYGEKSVEYIFGSRATRIYRVMFTAITVLGAVSKLELVWSISDTLNGLMAIPNLIAVTVLSGTVIREHRRFLKNIN